MNEEDFQYARCLESGGLPDLLASRVLNTEDRVYWTDSASRGVVPGVLQK